MWDTLVCKTLPFLSRLKRRMNCSSLFGHKMHLQVTIALFFILVTGGFCLDCYDCQDQPEGPCENQITCDDEHSMCASRGISKYESSESFCEEVTTATGCAMPNECDSFSIQCCDTDLCNQQDDSGISQYSDSTYGYDYVDYSNGKICYTCEKENCSQIQSCVRDEDYCFTAKGNHYQSHTLKGCASKRRCEDPSDSFGPGYSITCCWGDLCNSAQSVTQSFLFLCCSLLSFILLH
ncbi:four and a half LIM domains protein 1-like isoform X2 [Labeo rohita]|uniref:four and a half LIM domains protein 1-like isoform X2 n=1 Tax=Labeo rohita TaxID=84645 RepID=UPI0021E2C123|nr:four and a half LIM domains protein 1-like isoform X2 [Labeo rohita]